MSLRRKNDFEKLIDNVYQTHCILQENAAKAVNFYLTARNWFIGWHIVEYEQNGRDRAKYGNKLINEMAKSLKSKGLKGYSPMALRTNRIFYRTYPQIQQTLSVELQKTGIDINKLIPFQISQIQQTASVELQEEYPISAEILISRLSFSHFVELLRRKNHLDRLFYEVETIKNNWSVRELERAIDSGLFTRAGLSKDKESVIAKIKNQKPLNIKDIIRDPYFLDFLELDEKTEYSESQLETSILNHLQQFLTELGTGFCFEARQKRITFDNTHYRIDLVFYHRVLKSHILIDLKIGKFTHADAGQMNVYLNYYRENEMTEEDNPPIGIILCGDKNDTLVKYATNMDDHLFVSEYLLKLPEKKVLENFMKRELNQ
ncbi:MAG: PDDEXK nuclease domain-containing protein [Prevotellaceae bacterium]|jgi:predicted nuclease of restriction endonuclease-like (RecB) superfamily|nr:PDDEXK nuclease domain-containing protein [Prevotellaceae bacterium]